jgi:ADP-ribose pyrophosphatase
MNSTTKHLPDLTEHHLETEQVVQGKFITLHTDRVRLPDGAIAYREYVRHPGAVVIAAFIDDDTVVYRATCGQN